MIPSTAGAKLDPREIITPESFAVAPELLGVPLARPLRRAAAMLIDLLLIAMLVNAGRLLFAIAAAAVFLRVSGRGSSGGFLRRSWRLLFRTSAALILFAVVVSVWGSWRRDEPERVQRPAPILEAADPVVRADQPPAPLDSLLRAYTGALEQGDSLTLSSLRPALGGVLAADTVAALQARIRGLEGARERLGEQLEAARERRGLLAFLREAADDLGLGLGWSGLYFTAFLALWRGQTPGKRLLRIRVVRLDGKPMGWWASFERFGGYAASIFTGLLGFVQIVWDRNRQALHDKITETVVIRL